MSLNFQKSLPNISKTTKAKVQNNVIDQHGLDTDAGKQLSYAVIDV